MKGDPYYLQARYASTCTTCPKKIAAGDRMVWSPTGRRAFCVKPNSTGCGDEIMRNMATLKHTKAGNRGQ